MVVVLGFLILSYRETIKEYPSAGGAYLVTRDNFGIIPAQVAGASLLTDYILTVAVSAAAGTAALVSAFEVLAPYKVPIACFFIAVVAFGNLRGVKESGTGLRRSRPTSSSSTWPSSSASACGSTSAATCRSVGLLPETAEEVSLQEGLFYGAGIFGVLHAFASGGAAVTGVEAISNGVPAFQEPAWKNARQTLVIMGIGLGVMFLGLSALAAETQVGPSVTGTPTVIAQVGEAVYGSSPLGHVLFYSLQAGTMLILIMAANTGFADFPRLASFQASDRFLPRQMTKRGHRLVYSNGIVVLAGVAMLLVVATGGVVTRLIPLYAIGVFTGFTLSQAGMVKHHLTHRHPGWRKSIVIQGIGCFLSFVVLLIVSITKFPEGAWVILIVLPVLVVLLLRLNRQYESEAVELEHEVPAAATAPIMRRHVVLVFVDRLDAATARTIQYARSLTPDELRAVHFVIDDAHAAELAEQWRQLGLQRVPLELVACSDRRLTRAAVECVARELSDRQTEVSVLLPERKYKGIWHRILHDRTGDAIQEQVSHLAHANVTSVPFHFGSRAEEVASRQLVGVTAAPTIAPPDAGPAERQRLARRRGGPPRHRPDHRRALAPAGHRRRARALRAGGAPARLAHASRWCSSTARAPSRSCSSVAGRSPGSASGTVMTAEGVVGIHQARLAILNPTYRLID